MTDALVWALDLPPSRLRRAWWELSLADLRAVVRVKMGFAHAKAMQDLDNLIAVANQALGGKPGKKEPPPLEEAKPAPKTEAELVSTFKSFFGG